MPYLCGLQASSALAEASGIRAYIETQTVTLPSGGGLYSTAALQVTAEVTEPQSSQDPTIPGALGISIPISLTFGVGVFSSTGKGATTDPQIFYKLVNGAAVPSDIIASQVGKAGDGFHSYMAVLNPDNGEWTLLFDGIAIIREQHDSWKGVTSLTPSFIGEVPVIEVPVMGTSASPCKFEDCGLRLSDAFDDVDLTSGYDTIAQVGAATLDTTDTIKNAFHIAATA